MLKKFVLILSIFLIFSQNSFARPPRDLVLTYNHSEKILMISLKHIVDDKNEDFIRKLTVQVNEEKIITKYYRKQKNLLTFEEALNLDLKTGASITVKAYSSEGGSILETLIIPSQVTEEDSSLTDKK